MNHGGRRKGSGRKSKAEELQLIEKLGPLSKLAFDALEQGLKAGEFQYVKMYFEYMYGRPKVTMQADVNTTTAPAFTGFSFLSDPNDPD